MIRVFLAEDSPTVAAVFRRLVEGNPELQLVGVAHDGIQAMKELPELKPDILVTDIYMPKMDGLELIRWVMEEHPLPILVLSNTALEGGSTLAFQCLEAGATEIGPKPRGIANLDEQRREMQKLLRVLAGVKVVRRRPKLAATHHPMREQFGIVGVGASTGGPMALRHLFSGLPHDFSVPLLVAQHISEGFLDALACWLSDTTPIKAHVATDGETPLPGHAYFAPEGRNLELSPDFRLRVLPGGNHDCGSPSVDALFESLAKNMGARACGVLLTGMGKDGANGLLSMKKSGAWTIAQAENGCVVYGMPKAAAELGAASSVLELDLIPGLLASLCRRLPEQKEPK